MSAPAPWTGEAVRAALGLPGTGPGLFPAVSTDTRTVGPGDLFVALAGERFDGHDFVAEAFARGAAGAVVHSEPRGLAPGDESRLFRVEDTLVALGALARFRRRELGARGTRVVAITGSSGKTTVKEWTRAALAARWRVHATKGNLNNRIGVPLTILSTPPDTGMLLLEVGTSEPGEIGILTAMAAPETGVITTVGPAHLEKLGSLEGVLVEKTALAVGTAPDGWVLVGDDPPALAARARELRPRVRVAGWTSGADADLQPEDPRQEEGGNWSFGWSGQRVVLGVPGRHAVTGALLALAVAELHSVPPAAAAEAVSSVQPMGMRGERRRIGGLTALVDCYNANPQSVGAALATLAEGAAPGGRVAVLGSMLELGPESPEWHRQVLAQALALPLDLVVAVGLFAEAAGGMGGTKAGGAALLTAETPEEAAELLVQRLSGGETLLLKGSRGVALERIIPLLESAFGDAGPTAAGGG